MVNRYGVIIIDSPWRYRNKRRGDDGLNGTAEQLYDTLTQRELLALPVPALAARDCVLFSWATSTHLFDAKACLDAWGFDYVTKIPWLKIHGEPVVDVNGDVAVRPQMGVGWWVRGVGEDVLIAVRGKARRPAATWVGILSPNFGHSRKPENIHHYAEQWPGPHLEMFARRRRPGWDVFGNQVPGSITIEPATVVNACVDNTSDATLPDTSEATR